MRHKGGGTRVYYRKIDFKRDKTDIPAKVATIEYDPNRSAFIALLQLCRRRKALHPGPRRPEGGRHGAQRRNGRYHARKRAAD